MKTSSLDFGHRLEIDYERDGEWFECQVRCLGIPCEALSRKGYTTALAYALEDLAKKLKEVDK